MALDIINQEFSDAIREITFTAAALAYPYDRVRTMEWMKKLCELPSDEIEWAHLRNDYAQYLRIILSTEPVYFFRPFKSQPPKGDLVPLPEILCNTISDECPELPRTGPIQPILCHKTEDGKAFMTIKRCPDGGVFCYMAIAPDPFFQKDD